MTKDKSATIGPKEIRNLNRHHYAENKDNYDTTYMIENKKNGMVVEIKALSPVHACTMVGWKYSKCRVL